MSLLGKIPFTDLFIILETLSAILPFLSPFESLAESPKYFHKYGNQTNYIAILSVISIIISYDKIIEPYNQSLPHSFTPPCFLFFEKNFPIFGDGDERSIILGAGLTGGNSCLLLTSFQFLVVSPPLEVSNSSLYHVIVENTISSNDRH